MTGWIKENKLRSWGLFFGVIISFLTIVQVFDPIGIISNRIWVERKGNMIEALDSAIEVQELRFEPRFQAIELGLEEQKKTATERWEENLEIQKQILEEVKK